MLSNSAYTGIITFYVESTSGCHVEVNVQKIQIENHLAVLHESIGSILHVMEISFCLICEAFASIALKVGESLTHIGFRCSCFHDSPRKRKFSDHKKP